MSSCEIIKKSRNSIKFKYNGLTYTVGVSNRGVPDRVAVCDSDPAKMLWITWEQLDNGQLLIMPAVIINEEG